MTIEDNHRSKGGIDMSERVLDRIAEVADQLRQQAWEAEALGQLPETTVKQMKAAGSIRLLQPKKHGGLEVHPREFAETVMATAALDPAAGWVNGVVGVHPPINSPTRILASPRRFGLVTSTPGSPPPLRPPAGRRQAGGRRIRLHRSLAVQLRHRRLRLDHPRRDDR